MKKNDIIKELIEARKEKGLSQSDLARLIGTKRENISRIENGNQNISMDTLLKISSILDKKIDVTFSEDDNDVYILKNYDEDLITFRLYREKLTDYQVEILNVNKDKENIFPLDLKLNSEGMIKWLSRRIIPKNRYYVDEILESLGLRHGDLKGIIDVCKGLSLNDSYWVVKQDFKGSFKQFNLYENPFNKTLALIAYTGIYSDKRGFTTSPELTTGGMLPKAWRFFDHDGIYLYKGGSTIASNSGREPYIEYYACQIGKAMNLNIVNYDLEKWKGIIASKCPLFTDINTSYIPIRRIIDSGNINDILDYYDSLGKRFHDEIRDMLVFDALIYNEDRHFGNFGLLRDSHTGQIISPAPIFDNGLSLLCYIGKNRYSFSDIIQYAKTRISAYNIPFEDIVSEVIEKRQKNKLRKILNFTFTRHEKYNLNENFLISLEALIQERARYLLEL